ncbi:MAG: DMT family transporter [Pseudomonadales bacterium]|nr:DMT family transporter [Pseudomonadales bacterium]MCP5357341.1 DMT family transporter [Pseudomonadales bacterium]
MAASAHRFIPVLFVLVWSTGFIVARYGMPYSEPMTFLFLRFVGVLLVMGPVVLLWPARWPARTQILHIAVAGILLQAGYLGGVWAAVKLGMSASLVALIMGLQPIITAWLSALVAERVSGRQWLGLLVGLTGVAMVVAAKLSLTGLSVSSLLLSALALACITLGTLYQKRYCASFDLRAGSIIQFSASALVCLPFMFLFETRVIDWQLPMIASLLWSILALSIGAISLLFIMIRDGAATKVTSLLYLTPPTTALMAWILFDELITPMTLAGTALTVMALLLVVRGDRRVAA